MITNDACSIDCSLDISIWNFVDSRRLRYSDWKNVKHLEWTVFGIGYRLQVNTTCPSECKRTCGVHLRFIPVEYIHAVIDGLYKYVEQVYSASDYRYVNWDNANQYCSSINQTLLSITQHQEAIKLLRPQAFPQHWPKLTDGIFFGLHRNNKVQPCIN